MFLSRFCKPYQSQATAEKRYALHDTRDTPVARWLPHMVRTWGFVMSMVKINDALNRPWRRKIGTEGIVGLGGMGYYPLSIILSKKMDDTLTRRLGYRLAADAAYNPGELDCR